MLFDIFIEAVLDSIKMLPFLFLAYLLIEYIEHRHSDGIEHALARGGHLGFVPGALLGLVPQCGFSAMASNLYASKVITLGTLLAVFLSTSDEAIPLLLASPNAWRSLLPLLCIKIIVALVAGFLIDFVFARLLPPAVRGGYAGTGSDAVDCHEHVESDGIFVAACKHTLHIFLFIFL
ncbi:MAG: putative manganese transporter, partial [Ruthenibacterium sp.]